MSSSLSLPTPKELLATSVTGAVVFPAVLGLGQLAVFKPLRLAHSSPLASVCGCVSVLVAGCAASTAAVQAISLSRHWQSLTTHRERATVSGSVEFGARELLASTLASAVVFRALGGRFSSVLPSHLLHPGAFAREWIPVRATQATERQRQIIRELGRSHGCHSCGTRSVKQFHADHQPPTKVHNGPGVSDSGTGSQRLYPQCNRCSSLQGSVLAHGGSPTSKWSVIRTHALSLRGYHVFLPIPLAIVYLKLSEASVAAESNTPLATSVVSENKRKKKGESEIEKKGSTSQPQPKTLSVLFGESSLPNFIRDFPLLIIWNRLVYFLDSFKNSGDAFHITLLAFTVIAALGTI